MPFSVAEEHIMALEAELGWSLPRELRQRLLRANGGEIKAGNEDWILYPVWDPSDRQRMKRSTNHILRETQAARQACNFPLDAIAIADNGTGDHLIVRPNSPTIEWWNHETGQTTPVTIVGE